MQTHEIVELQDNGLLIIQSILPRTEFERGGSKHGYAYQFGVSKSMFRQFSQHLGLNEKEIEELREKVIY